VLRRSRSSVGRRRKVRVFAYFNNVVLICAFWGWGWECPRPPFTRLGYLTLAMLLALVLAGLCRLGLFGAAQFVRLRFFRTTVIRGCGAPRWLAADPVLICPQPRHFLRPAPPGGGSVRLRGRTARSPVSPARPSCAPTRRPWPAHSLGIVCFTGARLAGMRPWPCWGWRWGACPLCLADARSRRWRRNTGGGRADCGPVHGQGSSLLSPYKPHRAFKTGPLRHGAAGQPGFPSNTCSISADRFLREGGAPAEAAQTFQELRRLYDLPVPALTAGVTPRWSSAPAQGNDDCRPPCANGVRQGHLTVDIDRPDHRTGRAPPPRAPLQCSRVRAHGHGTTRARSSSGTAEEKSEVVCYEAAGLACDSSAMSTLPPGQLMCTRRKASGPRGSTWGRAGTCRSPDLVQRRPVVF